LSSGLIVVTANEREFSRVENLSVENWLNDWKTKKIQDDIKIKE
jgi:hypothetical protein